MNISDLSDRLRKYTLDQLDEVGILSAASHGGINDDWHDYESNYSVGVDIECQTSLESAEKIFKNHLQRFVRIVKEKKPFAVIFKMHPTVFLKGDDTTNYFALVMRLRLVSAMECIVE